LATLDTQGTGRRQANTEQNQKRNTAQHGKLKRCTTRTTKKRKMNPDTRKGYAVPASYKLLKMKIIDYVSLKVTNYKYSISKTFA